MNNMDKKKSILKINPINYLKGECVVQGDKSISHRAIQAINPQIATMIIG